MSLKEGGGSELLSLPRCEAFMEGVSILLSLVFTDAVSRLSAV